MTHSIVALLLALRAGGRSLLILVSLSSALGAPATGQDTDAGGESNGALEQLRARLELLERQHAQELDDLAFEIEGLQADIERLESAGSTSTTRNNAFNPTLTVIGNFMARADDRRVHVEDDPLDQRVDDQFNLREVELDLRAAIDPWADGVLIAAYHAEVSGESTAEIEEGYLTLKKLPFLDSAPLGLKLTAGRFRPGFGRVNEIHLHDLPWTTYPRSFVTFFGDEGTIDDGLSGRFFLPSPAESQTLETTLAVFNGGGSPLTAGRSRSDLSVLANLNWFTDLGSGKNLEVGVSGLETDSDHRLVGADATFKWQPAGGGRTRSFLLGGEVYRASLDEPGLADDPVGFYVWSQVQLARNVYLGVRFDSSEELTNSSSRTDTLGTYLTYYTSEFLRMRVAVEHVESDIALLDGRDSVFLELNFIYGSHPAEPYWVNP